MQTVLTIAGFDPSSGAGVTADLMVFAAHGLFGTSAITALTVQSTVGVRSTHAVAPDVLRSTLECLQDDLPPAGMKIGMLGTAANVSVACDYLEFVRETSPAMPVVLDPVLRSTSGRELLDREGVAVLMERLLPLVSWVTPNLAELSVLAGVDVARREDLLPAARGLQSRYPGLGVFATGGHLEPPDDLVVAPDSEGNWLRGERVLTRATHGTGCALSSAFLCRLVMGESAGDAARRAKKYVAGALSTAVQRGSGPCGMNHLWKIINVSNEA